MTGFEILKSKQQNQNESVWQSVAVYLMLVAVFVAYCSVFRLKKIDNVTIGIMPVFVILLIYLLQRIRWNKKAIIVGIAFAVLVIIGVQSYIINNLLPLLNSGFAMLVESFVEKYNVYYGTELSVNYALSRAKGNEIVVAMFIVQFVLGLILNIIIRKKRGIFMAVAIGACPAILEACVGYMPSVTATWISIIAIVFYVQCYKNTGNGGMVREIKVGSIILGILFIANLIFSPMIESYVSENDEEYMAVRNEIIKLQEMDLSGLANKADDIPIDVKGIANYSKGGIGKGSFKNLSRFMPDGVNEMEVTVSEMPKEDIYLRAFTASDYTSKGWKEMDEKIFKTISDESVVRAGQSFLAQPVKRIIDGMGITEMENMTIKLKNVSNDFGYAPYYAMLHNDYNVIMDGYIKGDGKRIFEYDYLPRYIADEVETENLADAGYSWYEYQDFVWSHYLSYPSGLDMLEEKCSHISNISVERMSDELDRYFDSTLTYFVAPGSCPKEEDFVEYFLFENKRGFCVHFASAATLMYRINGFPARYVEGYIIEPRWFEQQIDGTYKATVTDAMAHAWCETFDNEKGWQLREHTLGYAKEAGGENSNANEENNVTIQSEEEIESTHISEEITIDSSMKQKEVSDNSINESSKLSQGGAVKNISNVELKPVTIIIIILIIFLGCLLQRKIRRMYKTNKFRILSDNRGIRSIYTAVYEICIFQGISKNQMSDKELFAEMKAKFAQLKAEEWDWMYECVERAAYAPYKIKRNENRRMYNLYWKFRCEIVRHMPILKKIWFLYIKAM